MVHNVLCINLLRWEEWDGPKNQSMRTDFSKTKAHESPRQSMSGRGPMMFTAFGVHTGGL